MSTESTSSYIRVKHTGLSLRSIYLKDIDGEINRGNDRQKSACYVPYNGHIDVLLTDRTLASYQQGDIRGFITSGHVAAYVVRELRSGSLEEITYSGNKPISSITYTDNTKQSKIEERIWSYIGNLISSEIVKQYGATQTVILETRTDFTYVGNQVVSARETIQ